MDKLEFNERNDFPLNSPFGFNGRGESFECNGASVLQPSLVHDKPVPDIDYSVAAQFWGLAFTTTFFLWLFAKGIGEILKHVKNA
ncbi:hypothetical protein NQ871_000398 [Salmonella enterica]|nr:hypothetical protein CGA23_08095 [Salmonella enterica subsp. enterica]EAA2696282.1 hypothetical protein [Salmonella enterica]ECL7191998.1 hypothetical protein [Salmonella enterica subsp. enterica serovar Muenchen]EHF3500568.1 hypothetical protein [Salmonella enterica subsp. enterica serovar 6,8,20:d-]HBJ6609019.1 hypothetical protein [Salmonella enterica subsp. enterica serovar 6,8:d:-]